MSQTQIPPETITTQHLLLKLKVMAASCDLEIEARGNDELLEFLLEDLRQLISTIEQVTDSRQFYVEDVADILEIRGEKHLATKLWNIAWRIVEENR